MPGAASPANDTAKPVVVVTIIGVVSVAVGGANVVVVVVPGTAAQRLGDLPPRNDRELFELFEPCSLNATLFSDRRDYRSPTG